MKYRVIDSDNYAEHGIETFFFPGGEPHAKITKPLGREPLLLFLKLRTWNDVGLAVVVLSALAEHDAYVRIFMPYFPGARQDRSDGNSPCTAEVMNHLLQQFCFLGYTFDVHSPSSERWFTKNFMPADLCPSLPRYDGVIAPDAGAGDRALRMARYLGDTDVHVASKEREFSTGRITGYKINGLAAGKRYLVVDDICDGGATFNILADSAPIGVELDLWVSHGIFSRGVKNLSERYGQIFTTNSWWKHDIIDVSHLRVTYFSLSPIFNQIWSDL